MATCLADALFDDVARATVEVLEAAGCKVSFPEGQTCCGQPPFNAGDFGGARKLLAHTAEVFEDPRPVVTPSASCAAMVRHGAQLAFESQPREAARLEALGARTFELGTFLVDGLGIRSWPGRYHAQAVLHESCHGRGTPSPAAARVLLSSIEGLDLVDVDEPEQCCGFGGTFSVAFPTVSAGIGIRKRREVARVGAREVISADASCLMHLEGLGPHPDERAPVRFRHLAQVLRDALSGRGRAEVL